LKILLDHNLDRRLKTYLAEYETVTTQEQGWADVLNGELLTLLEENGYSVLPTAPTNIKTQQNIAGRKIGILVLRAFNNRLKTHLEMINDISKALSAIQDGEIIEAFHKDMKRKLN